MKMKYLLNLVLGLTCLTSFADVRLTPASFKGVLMNSPTRTENFEIRATEATECKITAGGSFELTACVLKDAAIQFESSEGKSQFALTKRLQFIYPEKDPSDVTNQFQFLGTWKRTIGGETVSTPVRLLLNARKSAPNYFFGFLTFPEVSEAKIPLQAISQ